MMYLIVFIIELLAVIGWVGVFVYNGKNEIIPIVYIWFMFPFLFFIAMNWVVTINWVIKIISNEGKGK